MGIPIVDLWLCSLSDLHDDIDSVSYLKQRLTMDEIAKVDRYRMPSSQVQALYVRNYLRKVLSCYSDLRPEEWRFEYGEKGKPSLVAEQQLKTGLNFNISHSKEHLLIAVCQIEGKSTSIRRRYRTCQKLDQYRLDHEALFFRYGIDGFT